MQPQGLHDPLFQLGFVHRFGDVLAADVAGHDDDGVSEVHGAALAVGEAAVVQDLEQRR